jgi:hypothetical protein
MDQPTTALVLLVWWLSLVEKLSLTCVFAVIVRNAEIWHVFVPRGRRGTAVQPPKQHKPKALVDDRGRRQAFHQASDVLGRATSDWFLRFVRAHLAASFSARLLLASVT